MSGPPLSRRGVVLSAGLGAVAGTGVLSGCDFDGGTAPSTPVAPSTPDADEGLLLAARGELVGLLAGLEAAIAHPGRAGDTTLVDDLAGAHRVQLAALGGVAPASGAGVRPLDGRRLVAREHAAAARFAGWAAQARSGDLALVLAAVAAGIRTWLVPGTVA